jgi:tRNA-2-methylthio-N6-dimethylallyladenosine synthase
MSRRYHVQTFGCQMNEHDSERIAGLLEADGLERSERTDDADVVVLNTCCIRENADDRLYGSLGWLKPWKEGREGRQIVVAGCLSQKDRGRVRERAPWVDVVMGTHNVHRAADLVASAAVSGPVTEILDEAVLDDHALFPSALPASREVSYRAWVTIQIGCDNTCAYCIVPAVRGREYSREPADVVAEVRRLAASGVTEVTLLGQNVNSYGRDLALAERRAGADVRTRPRFASLLRDVAAVPGIRRVRFTSPHPKDMNDEALEAMATASSVCEHLHFPLQSGSDRVLAAMHRGYTGARYLERLAVARATVPDLAVTTDLIVGFPGETEDDFTASLEVVAEAGFDSAYLFVFSPREGTEAAGMVDRFVDADAVADRFARMKAVLDRSAVQRHAARIGRTEEIVVEGRNERRAGQMSGRTRQNKLVHFDCDEPLRPGTYATVEIVSSARFHLGGRLLEVTAEPSHRRRIDVAAC